MKGMKVETKALGASGKMHISRRLTQLAAMLPPVGRVADIGTDHAQLLTYLIKEKKIEFGLGVEIVEGPYQNALQQVGAQGLNDSLEIRKGDGLAPLEPGEVEAVIIAGMGGSTMVEILKHSPQVVAQLSWLLLQPMSQVGGVRQYLQQIGWRIRSEVLLEERQIIYPLLLLERGFMAPLTELEAEYGPLLLSERPRSTLLQQLLTKDRAALQEILSQLAKSNQVESRRKAEAIREKCCQLEVLFPCP